MRRFKMSWEKCLEGMHLLASEQAGITPYYLSKIFYFADKEHLLDYGRPISGDRYIAMENGPVPSSIYDIIKRNEFLEDWIIEDYEKRIEKSGLHMKAKEPFVARALSKSDTEYLIKSLKKYIGMSFGQLKELSHKEEGWKEAWKNPGLNNEMDLDLWIGDDLGPRDEVLEEISEKNAYI